MIEVTRAQERVDELRDLLRQVQDARRDVPSIARATSAVGARGTWTGSAADRLHHDEMVPAADALPAALRRLETAVADELAHAERTLRRAEDEARTQDLVR